MMKKLTMLGSILLLVGLVGAAFTFKSVFNVDSETEEQTIEEYFDLIEIDTEDIAVNIGATDGDVATVEMVTRSSEYNVMTEVVNNTLTVNVKHEFKKLFSFDIFDFTPTLNIAVPEKTYKKLNINTTNGIISVENVASEKVDAISTNGIIKLHDITAERVKTETTNGMINLNNVAGEITSVTTNGKIDLHTPDLDRMIDLKTMNGTIKVVTEEAPTNTTIAANINNGKATVFGSFNPYSVYGDGENQIVLTTENGMITVE